MKTALNVILGVLLAPIVIFIILTAALYTPPVQDWAVNTLSRHATQGTGLNVHVGRVGLSFPLDLDTRRILATTDEGDTILSLDRAVVDLDLSRILDLRLGLDALTLEGATIHTGTLIDSLAIDGTVARLHLAAPEGIDINRHTVKARCIELDDSHLTIIMGEMPADTTATDALPWTIDVAQASIASTTLTFATDSLWAQATIAQAEARQIAAELASESYRLASLHLSAEAKAWLPALCPDTLCITPIEMGTAALAYTPQEISLQSLAALVRNTRLEASLCLDLNTRENSTEHTQGKCGTQSAQIRNTQLPHYQGTFSASTNRGDVLWVCHALGTDTMELSRVLPPLVIQCQGEALDDSIAATASLIQRERCTAQLQASIHLEQEAYDARLDLRGLAPRSFVRTLPVGPVTATLTASGRGFDPYSAATVLNARGEVRRCTIDSLDLRDVCMAASYRSRKASLLVDCNNRLIDGNIGFAALVTRRDSILTRVNIDINKADLYGLHLTRRPLQVAGLVHLEGTSDLVSRHDLSGTITGLSMLTADTLVHPKDLAFDALVHRDSLAAQASAGDLTLGFTAGCGITELLRKSTAFADTLTSQLARYQLEQERLRTMLPRAEIRLSMGNDNPVAHIAQALGYSFDAFRLRLGADPTIGLNGGMALSTLKMAGVTIDNTWCNIYQDTTGVKMDARVHNTPRRDQIAFDARANAYVLPSGAGLHVSYADDRGRKGVDMGAEIDYMPDGISLHLTPLTPTIAYRTFTANDSNYVFLSPDGRVSADLQLLAHDGTGMKLYSTPQDTTGVAALPDSVAATLPTTLQDLTLSLNNVNVAELCDIMPYMPRLTGMLYGDTHLVQTTQTLSVAVDAGVDAFTYEGAEIGDVMLNASYLPVGDSCHYVDGLLMLDGEEIAVLGGHYTDDGRDGQIEATAELAHLPLEVAGRLAGDPNLVTLGGDMDGIVTVHGSPSRPIIDGFIATDGVQVNSPAYNVKLRVSDDTISIARSRLMLGGIDIFSTGRTPLTVDGWVDFFDTGNITLDTRLTAQRFELINAKRTTASLAYGKVLVDADATLRGSLSRLNMQGRLTVLGGTDVTYILQDSPLTVEDRMAGLVTFTDFNDTLYHEAPPEAPPMAVTARMAVSIEESAQVHCLLSPDRTSYVDIEGGGDLVLTYTPQGDLSMTGRYTIISGEMKYALPVIPLKTFRLQSGSYVAWNGKLLNPTLDIAATERVRAAVSSETGANRSVAFDVGVAITQTLDNMGLAFTVEAPEDATIQNELQSMDAAARGRVAVTMLATGMYITDTGSSGGFSTTNALGSFLQSEISNIAGRALGSLDVNVGVEEGTGRTGGQTTDYSFSFAKRFWNNRISVSFGGRVSSGSDAYNTGATIIDNVAIEYRLDQSATRYVRLSYDKNYESLLEGNITEMGAGLVLRRKTTRLGELFIFRRKKKEDSPTPIPSQGRGVNTSAQ